MNKDDKKFFTDLISDVKKERTEDRHYFTGLFTDLKILIKENKDAILENKDAIRYNGILIEENSSKIDLLAEGHGSLSYRINNIENDIHEIKENIAIIPSLVQVIKNHSKKLATL